MLLMHTGDLHIGKRLRGYPFLEDQETILQKILCLIEEEKPDALLISGDLYDRSQPSAEAVSLLDWFLSELAKRGVPTFVISGNHDSPERVAYGGRIMKTRQIYISPVYDGKVTPISLQDEWGEVYFYLLPFVRPARVRDVLNDESIVTDTDALRAAIAAMQIDTTARNVLVAHQFVTGGEYAGSEEIGNTGSIDANVFADFDYVALGHLHGAQSVGKPSIRYSGSPLKYSFAEASHQKSVTMVDFKEKENLQIREIPLEQPHEMERWKGKLAEIRKMRATENLLEITLTDDVEIPDAIGSLQQQFPNLLHLSYDNQRTRAILRQESLSGVSTSASPIDLFSMLFEKGNGRKMSEEQRAVVEDLIKEIWGEER